MQTPRAADQVTAVAGLNVLAQPASPRQEGSPLASAVSSALAEVPASVVGGHPGLGSLHLRAPSTDSAATTDSETHRNVHALVSSLPTSPQAFVAGFGDEDAGSEGDVAELGGLSPAETPKARSHADDEKAGPAEAEDALSDLVAEHTRRPKALRASLISVASNVSAATVVMDDSKLSQIAQARKSAPYTPFVRSGGHGEPKDDVHTDVAEPEAYVDAGDALNQAAASQAEHNESES